MSGLEIKLSKICLVHEPNGNLPTPNNLHRIDYFYRKYAYVLPVATPTKTTDKLIYNL